ncbi:MAG: type II toxin-antitoxin system RelE/ParE family toxin [archaeon]
MSYELVIDEEAIRFLEKLEKRIRERIFLKLQRAKNDPFHFFERLEGRADYKLRVGDYRAIADIADSRIIVTCIGHRKSIYKRR